MDQSNLQTRREKRREEVEAGMRLEHRARSANELHWGERNDPQWAFYSLSEWNFEAFMLGIND